jgi:hypothetical protein
MRGESPVEQNVAFFYLPSAAFAGFFVAAGEHDRGVCVLMPMATNKVARTQEFRGRSELTRHDLPHARLPRVDAEIIALRGS